VWFGTPMPHAVIVNPLDVSPLRPVMSLSRSLVYVVVLRCQSASSVLFAAHCVFILVLSMEETVVVNYPTQPSSLFCPIVPTWWRYVDCSAGRSARRSRLSLTTSSPVTPPLSCRPSRSSAATLTTTAAMVRQRGMPPIVFPPSFLF
jgi:hypothetical protein